MNHQPSTINHSRLPTTLSIAGTDPTSGAGIQADLKTFHGLGVYGCTVLTAVIAQNTQGVQAVEFPSDDIIRAQLASVTDDVPPAAIKIGMLGKASIVRIVADLLDRSNVPAVCDPVLKSSGGMELLEHHAIQLFRRRILPKVTVLTPNLSEAGALLGRTVELPAGVAQAASDLRAMGPRAVLLKGGHAGGGLSMDYWTDGRTSGWLVSPRRDTPHTHGGGCTLSSAIAAGIALGLAPLDAAVLAKAYVNQGLRLGGGIGKGRGPLAHGGWPESPEDMPWLAPQPPASESRLRFPEAGPLGLYPIVDRAEWIERLAASGADMIQLRVKDLEGVNLEREIERGCATAKRMNVRLYVNDRWDLALRFGAWGVHLGQDDLDGADLAAIHSAGLRLGLSTHGFAEIARSLCVLPSYLAIGTVFESPSKNFKQNPLGLDRFRKMRPLVPVPVVAIGGITLERAKDVYAAGADGIAVISDVVRARDVSERIAAWRALARA